MQTALTFYLFETVGEGGGGGEGEGGRESVRGNCVKFLIRFCTRDPPFFFFLPFVFLRWCFMNLRRDYHDATYQE